MSGSNEYKVSYVGGKGWVDHGCKQLVLGAMWWRWSGSLSCENEVRGCGGGREADQGRDN